MEFPKIRGEPPSLVQLCVLKAIDNIQYLGDVGETDMNLLKIILSHCTPEQLMFIEESTEGRDLTPATNEMWLKFYERKFGVDNVNLVKRRMKERRVSFKWKLLYEAKIKEAEEQQQKSMEKLKNLYAKVESEKNSKKIKMCSIVPPDRKRNFGWGGSTGKFANVKGRLMKKAKIEFAANQEALAHARQYNKTVQPHTAQPLGKSSSLSRSSSSLSPFGAKGLAAGARLSSAQTSSQAPAYMRTASASDIHGKMKQDSVRFASFSTESHHQHSKSITKRLPENNDAVMHLNKKPKFDSTKSVTSTTAIQNREKLLCNISTTLKSLQLEAVRFARLRKKHNNDIFKLYF